MKKGSFIMVMILVISFIFAFMTTISLCAENTDERLQSAPKYSQHAVREYSQMTGAKAVKIIREKLGNFPSPNPVKMGSYWKIPDSIDGSLLAQGIDIDKNDWVIIASVELVDGGAKIIPSTNGLPKDAQPAEILLVPIGLFAATTDLIVIDNECFARGSDGWAPADRIIKKGYYILYAWQNGIILSRGMFDELIILSKDRYKNIDESPFIRKNKIKKAAVEQTYFSPPLISAKNSVIDIKFAGAKSFLLK